MRLVELLLQLLELVGVEGGSVAPEAGVVGGEGGEGGEEGGTGVFVGVQGRGTCDIKLSVILILRLECIVLKKNKI